MELNNWQEIRELFINLNKDNNLQPRFLRRNRSSYGIISTIEMAFAFLMSGAYDNCAFYIWRANNEKIKLNNFLEQSEEKEFIEKGLQILFQIKGKLLKENLISENMKKVIGET